MINGKCTTWQVIRWLEKHPTHIAEAPEFGKHQRTRIVSRSSTDFAFEYSYNESWYVDSRPNHRSDWTIYDERGRKVMFKKKRKMRVVGELRHAEDLVAVCYAPIRDSRSLIRNGGNNTVDVLIRERRP